jgi:hypothetical protein
MGGLGGITADGSRDREARPIIAAAGKEFSPAENHLSKALAILPEKVDVIPAPNEFNQAISRATAL